MPRTCTPPRFTEGNKLFMYRLLRDQLGCGKQTFMTRVEEVLAQDRLTAEDLGFDSTLQLLEELGADVVKITLFKGGRAYATIQVKENWDKALDAPENKAPSKGNKPWKKKKGDKSIKPSCPRRIKREAAKPDMTRSDKEEDAKSAPSNRRDASTSASETSNSAMPDSTSNPAESTDQKPGEVRKATPRDPRLRNANFSLEDAETSEPGTSKDGARTGDEANQACAVREAALIPDETSEGAGERAADSPHIALTVTYDPYTGQLGESSLVATPEDLARRAAEKAAAEAARRAAQEATAAAARAAQIARERRAAVIAAAIAERAAQKEAEAARELAEAEARARAEAEADMAAMEDANQPDKAALEAAKHGGSTVPDLEASAGPAQDALPHKEIEPENSPIIDTDEAVEQNAIHAADQDAPASADELEPSAPAPALPSDFPLDFSSEVFCPGPLLHALTMLYPYGADVMGIVSEYCLIARERGNIEASRSKATFSICYLQDGHRATANVVIRRRREAGMGAAWAIDSVTVAETGGTK